jgi:hypothetical protein
MFHQSNLTGDRLLYDVVGGVLTSYRNTYAANTPVVNQRLSAAGAALNSQGVWAQTLSAGTVSGYIQGGTVTITGPSGTSVPVTAPTGTRVGSTRGAVFGSAYGGEVSAYTTLGSGPLTLVVPGTPYPGATAAAAKKVATAVKAAAPKVAATSHAVKSTAAINARKNPAALPGGKLGTAVLNAVNGPAATAKAKTSHASKAGR